MRKRRLWMWIAGCVLALPAFLIIWHALREASFHVILWRYSREFTPGMTRKQVEDRLVAESVGFQRVVPEAQAGATTLPLGRMLNRVERDTIDLGGVENIACSITEIISLDFDMRSPDLIDDEDVLFKVGLRRRENGCL